MNISDDRREYRIYDGRKDAKPGTEENPLKLRVKTKEKKKEVAAVLKENGQTGGPGRPARAGKAGQTRQGERNPRTQRSLLLRQREEIQEVPRGVGFHSRIQPQRHRGHRGSQEKKEPPKRMG
jgi:hypothetical protein